MALHLEDWIPAIDWNLLDFHSKHVHSITQTTNKNTNTNLRNIPNITFTPRKVNGQKHREDYKEDISK